MRDAKVNILQSFELVEKRMWAKEVERFSVISYGKMASWRSVAQQVGGSILMCGKSFEYL